MERTNDRYMQIQTLNWRAALALDRDDVNAALKMLRDSERLTRESGGPFGSIVRRYLADAFSRQGRAADARAAADAARAEAPEEDPQAQATALMAEGFAAAAEGEQDTARQRFSQALPVIDELGNRMEAGESRLMFARLLARWGDTIAAADQLERARESFAQVGATATVAEIDAWVDRLQTGADQAPESATA